MTWIYCKSSDLMQNAPELFALTLRSRKQSCIMTPNYDVLSMMTLEWVWSNRTQCKSILIGPGWRLISAHQAPTTINFIWCSLLQLETVTQWFAMYNKLNSVFCFNTPTWHFLTKMIADCKSTGSAIANSDWTGTRNQKWHLYYLAGLW